MLRRNFIKLTIGLIGLAFPLAHNAKKALAQSAPFDHETGDIILDQSGIFGKQAFVVGVLSCKDFSSANSYIKTAREETSFRCKLSHSSRNKYKLQYVKRLIDYWIDDSDIKIDLFIMRSSKGSMDEKPEEEANRYNQLISEAINSSQKYKKNYRLVTQQHYRGARQDIFENFLEKTHKSINSIININDNQSDLIQFIGLIVGSVYVSFDTSPQLKNKAKKEILEYLVTKLKTKSLIEPLKNKKCSITVV